MVAPRCSEGEFIELFTTLGAHGTARRLDCGVRQVFERRQSIERRRNIVIKPPKSLAEREPIGQYAQRIEAKIDDGVVLIGSDSHYWPGCLSAGHRAFVKFCRMLAPKIVIKNGDELDGATISRHMPIGWERRPTLVDEMEEVKKRLGEITLAAGKARRIWPLGNHDARFETRLAHVAPEYAKIHGVHLKDHFPDWEPCWSVAINDDVMVKHRFRGGIHATHNNVLHAGKTIVTGHLHNPNVRPFTDYNGDRWGVDCGTLADPHGPQFEYLEDNPRNWRSGFAVLTFVGGMLLQPELVRIVNEDHADFRGALIEI